MKNLITMANPQINKN